MRSDAFAWLEEGREGNRRDGNMERVTSRGLDRIMPAGGRIYRIRRDYATRCSLIGSNGRRCKWLGIVMVSSNESIVVCSGTMHVAHYPVISVTIPRQDAIRASLDKHKRAAVATSRMRAVRRDHGRD